jgi:hypothetical protein
LEIKFSEKEFSPKLKIFKVDFNGKNLKINDIKCLG